MRLFFGCSQWGYESWRGSIYPESAAPHEYLRFYSKIFNSVELNTTFYNGAEAASLLRWKGKVSSGFRFCPKFPKSISHDSRLENCELQTHQFLKAVNVLADNLGHSFLQLRSYFGMSELNSLKKFLELIPKDFRICIEPRISAIKDSNFIGKITDILRENSAGIVITDSAETRPYLNNLQLTSHTAFIRFISYDHSTDLMRINEWFGQLRKWRDRQLPEVYFFLHFPSEQSNTGLVNKFREECETFISEMK